MIRGKVVLLPFPFDDLSTTKVRPAVCPVEEIRRLTHIDPWFLRNIWEIVEMEDQLVKAGSLEALA